MKKGPFRPKYVFCSCRSRCRCALNSDLTPKTLFLLSSTDGDKVHSNLDAPLPTETSTNGETATLLTGDPSTTPNGMRPTNPTPAHATGDGTPTLVRPTNPTPSHASTAGNPRPSNPTPKQASELFSQESPLQGDSPQWTTNLESVQEVDVPSPVGEVVEGPVEAEDPDAEENIPIVSGEFENWNVMNRINRL